MILSSSSVSTMLSPMALNSSHISIRRTTGHGRFAECKMICRAFSVGHSAKAIFAESRTQRHSAKIGRRQICLCREPDTRQTLAVGKNFPLPSAGRSAKIGRRQKNLCRVPGTRQNLAVGKGGRRDGGHLPSTFAECPVVRRSTKGFLFF